MPRHRPCRPLKPRKGTETLLNGQPVVPTLDPCRPLKPRKGTETPTGQAGLVGTVTVSLQTPKTPQGD